ncbi:MAG: hypothetical protein ACN0LA_03280 [Candidatus Longimicrobiales bacterium M2_2A_002]
MGKTGTELLDGLMSIFKGAVAIMFAILIWSAFMGDEPSPEDRAYNDCMRRNLGHWADDHSVHEIPDSIYVEAIGACDHLDPSRGETTGG